MKGMEDFEAARQAFDELLKVVVVPTNTNTNTNTKPPLRLPLTASSKRVKEMELALLEYLQDSDDTIDRLVDLWMCEREDAAPLLRKMEEHCSPGLHKEERELRQMIEHYGNGMDDGDGDGDCWVEPMSRLALLLFTKGNYQEASSWCWKVLEAKPWHFEVAHLLVALSLRQDQFATALRTAREYSLPSLNDKTDHKRRRAWVARAMSKAQEILNQAEMATAAYYVQDEQLEECPVGDEDMCWQ